MPATPLRAASSAAMAQETMVGCMTGVSATALSMLRRLILGLVMVHLFSLTARCTASATTDPRGIRLRLVHPSTARTSRRKTQEGPPAYLGPSCISKCSATLDGNLQRHLHSAGSVLLRGSHHSEAGAGGVAVGRREARMVERVVRLEPELGLQSLADQKVLVDAHVEGIGAAGADAAPARRVVADVSREVLVDTVLGGIAGGRFVIGAGQAHHAGRCGIGGDEPARRQLQ